MKQVFDLNSVAILHSLYSPHIVGGAEISTQILAETLSDVLKVQVVTVGPQSKEQGIMKEQINNVLVRRLPANNLYWYGDRTVKRSMPIRMLWRFVDAFNFKHYLMLKRIFMETRPSIIHTQNLTGLSVGVWKAAHDLKIPIVHTLRDYSLLEPINVNLYSAMYRKMSTGFSKYVSGVVGISKFVLDKHLENGLFPNARAWVVPNVVVGESDNEFVLKSASDTKELVIGYFGQLASNKGIEYLIDAVKELPDDIISKLYICGEGELMEELKRQTGGDNRFIFTGKLQKEQVKEKMLQMDVTVVPSVWDEPFGRVIIESYQTGTPVYASRVGGIPDVVIDAGEYCFEPRSKEAIKDCILSYFQKSQEERKAIRNECRNHSRKFNVTAHKENYLNIYREILK